MWKMTVLYLLMMSFSVNSFASEVHFSVLNSRHYQKVVFFSRHKIQRILETLQPYRRQSIDLQVAAISSQLMDIPYSSIERIGEGDWQPRSTTYKGGALHNMQFPVYRLDFFDCQSFVQVAIALLHSQTLKQFDNNYLKISYGAANNPNNEIVKYYNRNHFVDGDLNPVNQKSGWFIDVTSQGDLASYTKKTTAKISRQNWFSQQDMLYILNAKYASEIAQTLKKQLNNLNLPRFKLETVTLSYLPKQLLAVRQKEGNYIPNFTLFNKISTPAVIELVSNSKKMKQLVGTETNVSHLGLLYRHSFKKGDLIYHKISCYQNREYEKKCDVIPIQCQKQHCNELMLVHATRRHPDGFYWYQHQDGRYTCAPRSVNAVKGKQHDISCNRVEQIPLFDYLTDYQYGLYRYMREPSFLGIHIEKLL